MVTVIHPRFLVSPAFCEEIRKRLDSYFEVTVRNVRDSIPKAIGYYLVSAPAATKAKISLFDFHSFGQGMVFHGALSTSIPELLD